MGDMTSVNGSETVTVVGRHPVAELLALAPAMVHRVHVAASARGGGLDALIAAAEAAAVTVEVVNDRRLDSLAGGGGEHQGVVATATLPLPAGLDGWLADRRGRPVALLVIDGVTTPANLGIVLRTAVAVGVDGVVVPDVGTAGLGSATLKASAGVALTAPVLRATTIDDVVECLQRHAVEIVAFDAGGDDLFTAELPRRAAYVVGNESVGISRVVRVGAAVTVALKMAPGVESLNVAAAASVLLYELARRGLTDPGS